MLLTWFSPSFSLPWYLSSGWSKLLLTLKEVFDRSGRIWLFGSVFVRFGSSDSKLQHLSFGQIRFRGLRLRVGDPANPCLSMVLSNLAAHCLWNLAFLLEIHESFERQLRFYLLQKLFKPREFLLLWLFCFPVLPSSWIGAWLDSWKNFWAEEKRRALHKGEEKRRIRQHSHWFWRYWSKQEEEKEEN